MLETTHVVCNAVVEYVKSIAFYPYLHINIHSTFQLTGHVPPKGKRIEVPTLIHADHKNCDIAKGKYQQNDFLSGLKSLKDFEYFPDQHRSSRYQIFKRKIVGKTFENDPTRKITRNCFNKKRYLYSACLGLALEKKERPYDP